MAVYLVAAALLLLLAGAALLLWGRRLRAGTGLPGGEVVYSDTGAREELEKPLVSRRYGLVGKPDYLLHRTEQGRKLIVPVEVKSRRKPAVEHPGHALQLAAYCLMVEEVYGVTPAYGLLRYADATVPVPLTEELRGQVLAAAEAIRSARRAADVPRQHEVASRCTYCGYRHACGQEM